MAHLSVKKGGRVSSHVRICFVAVQLDLQYFNVVGALSGCATASKVKLVNTHFRIIIFIAAIGVFTSRRRLDKITCTTFFAELAQKLTMSSM